mmetsp:Transcript_5003/g.9412  ORF Transcript_5003/g.9412 Transcript_5003/m.9412 type:complete len:220 (-) Transcript_5003:265-924(-)
MPADTAVPRGADALDLYICKASLCEPVNVLSFGGKEHPEVCHHARQPEGGVHRAYQAGHSTGLEDTVRLADSALRVRPVLDTASRRVSVGRVGFKREVLRVTLDDCDTLKFRLGASLCELMRGLVQKSNVLWLHFLHNSQSAESRATAHIVHLQIRGIQLSHGERVVAHVHRPVARVHNVIVHYGQESVEPEGFLLVLDQTGCIHRTAGRGCCSGGSRC